MIKSSSANGRTDWFYGRLQATASLGSEPRYYAKDFREKMVKAKMRTTDGICVDEKDNLYVADFSNNAVDKVDRQGHITVLAQSPDCDGSDGGLNQPGEPIVWNGKLVISCFDAVTGPTRSTPSTIRPIRSRIWNCNHNNTNPKRKRGPASDNRSLLPRLRFGLVC